MIVLKRFAADCGDSVFNLHNPSSSAGLTRRSSLETSCISRRTPDERVEHAQGECGALETGTAGYIPAIEVFNPSRLL